jgi:alpha/beta hydrolase family protein
MAKRLPGSVWVAGALVAAASLGGAAAGAVSVATAPFAPVKHCKRGTTSAVVAGTHVCLAAGQTCRKAVDKQYHRYKFHCHNGKLTRFKPNPAPPPPPPAPPPLPGVKVDVGGYKLYIHCIGSGGPTVVFEGGSGTADATRPAPASADIRAGLSSGTRVCAYDRAGLGASDPRPAGAASTGKRYADELHALLAGASVPGPYVLVGASHGGYMTMSYALYYPSETAGLVFVDSVAPCTCVVPEVEPGQFELASVSFGTRPVVVLRATLTNGRDLASRSTNIILVDADSSHFLAQERPQLVVEATRLVVAAVRSGTPLPPCAQTPLPAAGGKCE